MNLENSSQENLEFILKGLGERLDVANLALLDPKHYDIDKYSDLKFMYDMIVKKGRLSSLEIQAFIDELRSTRKV